jgi:hypothetical protein
MVGLGSLVGLGSSGEVGVKKGAGGLGEGATGVGMVPVGVAWLSVSSGGFVGVGGALIGGCVGGIRVALGKGRWVGSSSGTKAVGALV